MRTRSHQTPLSVKVAVGLWLLFAAVRAFNTIKLATLGAPGLALGGQAIAVSIALYYAAATARLSRWPVLIYPAMAGLSAFGLYSSHYVWREHYPILGPLAVILPPVIFLALTLPHWRKMNWALFGRPYRPPADQAEVFA